MCLNAVLVRKHSLLHVWIIKNANVHVILIAYAVHAMLVMLNGNNDGCYAACWYKVILDTVVLLQEDAICDTDSRY